MDVPSDLAVIRAHLPYVDRRALSEAWYAALRLEQTGGEPVKVLEHAEQPAAEVQKPEQRISEAGAKDADVTQKLPATKGTREGERLGPEQIKRSSQARARDACPIEQPRPVTSASSIGVSFTVTVGDTRVRVVARGNANRLHLTAVCSARHVDMVRRALAHATLGLRQQGALVDSNLHCHEELQ